MTVKIRRFWNAVWPSPAEESELNPREVFRRYYEVIDRLEEKNITAPVTARLYEASKYLFEQEEQRRVKLDQKATNSLNATVVASALVIGLAPLLLAGTFDANDPLTAIIVACYLLSSTFLSRAAVAAIRAHGEIIRFCLGPEDIVPPAHATDESYVKHLALKLLRYTIENYKVNNKYMAIVHAAQRCFRNGVILLGLFGFLITAQARLHSRHTESDATAPAVSRTPGPGGGDSNGDAR